MFSVTDLLVGPECLFNVGYYIKQAPMLFLLLPVYEMYLIWVPLNEVRFTKKNNLFYDVYQSGWM